MEGVDEMVKKIVSLRNGEGERSTLRIYIGHGARGLSATRTAARRGSAEKPDARAHAQFGRGTPVSAVIGGLDCAFPVGGWIRGQNAQKTRSTVHWASANQKNRAPAARPPTLSYLLTILVHPAKVKTNKKPNSPAGLAATRPPLPCRCKQQTKQRPK